MKIAVIYHDADFDGVLSREVCNYFLSERENHEVHEYGWDYNKTLPMCRLSDWDKYDNIYIVDLSNDELMGRDDLVEKIVWIDHHKSAISKYESLDFNGLRMDGVAACRLCWYYFQLNDKLEVKNFDTQRPGEPLLLTLAGLYDVWKLDDERTKPLQFGLKSLSELEFKKLVKKSFLYSLDSLEDIYRLVNIGRSIKSYSDKQSKQYAVDHSHTIKFYGLTFCALNIGQRGDSDLFIGGIKPEHDACFGWRFDGEKVLVSLYHIPGKTHHDLSVIATKYGGGGHKGACGFKLMLKELVLILS